MKLFEDRQNPSSIRLQQCRRRLTEDHIGLHGDKPLRQHLRPPRRAKLATKPEPMGSATPANTGPTPPLRLAFPVNKIPISAAIERRGAQAMVLLVLR